MGTDFWIVLRWWGSLFLVGAVAFPLTKALFSGRCLPAGKAGIPGQARLDDSSKRARDDKSAGWHDLGYFFAKAVGMAVVTFVVYLLAFFHILPFTELSVWISMGIVFGLGLWVNALNHESGSMNHEEIKHKRIIHNSLFMIHGKKDWLQRGTIILIEELCFLLALLFWSWVKGHEPSIHGLEKFMDFGFMKSILNSSFFPAPDMWYAGFPINYYYFGHTVVAVLTKLSGIDLVYTFNLMLATIFALCLTMSYSIGKQICQIGRIGRIGHILGGLLTAFLVTLAGNMQTLYAFTQGYTGDKVKPFWQLLWPLRELWVKLPEGLERYWYANATRFIPFTIHEFPSYSFVVSDIHGHVLSIPFVLLAIGLLITIFGSSTHKTMNQESGIMNYGRLRLGFYGLLVAILLMTNALDGPIYLGLFLVLFMIHNSQFIIQWKKYWKQLLIGTGTVVGTAVAASIPFMSRFSSFVSGVALNCPPAFLADRKIGILLFEGVEKCQHSPVWMMWLLWGFFIYCGGLFIVTILLSSRPSSRDPLKKEDGFRAKPGMTEMKTKFTQVDILLMVFFFFSVALLIFPEFFYFKDIYPAHFRSNTMFKLGYQAFIMLSIVAGYTIILAVTKGFGTNPKSKIINRIFLVLLIPQLFLVSIFPIFSVRSYFDSLRTYKGLDGTMWLAEQYPDDWAGIIWLNNDASTHRRIDASAPVIVEADGDSYTDHARFSAFTGLPAVIGWPVHEWLWRGSYDVVAPRREEVRVIYESDDLDATRAILKRYNVTYIIVGGMERKKFTSLNTDKLDILGTVVFEQGETSIYYVNP